MNEYDKIIKPDIFTPCILQKNNSKFMFNKQKYNYQDQMTHVSTDGGVDTSIFKNYKLIYLTIL